MGGRFEREGLVREDEVAAELPLDSGRHGARQSAGDALRRPRLLSRAAATPDGAKAFLLAEAHAEGFDVARIASPEAAPEMAERLGTFLAEGHHGDMAWLEETAPRRRSPRGLWPKANAVVMLGLNYGPDSDPLASLAERSRATISVYARNRDYHDLIKGKLKRIASRFAARTGSEVKIFVDTAPLMEKPLAAAAGIGWQGKHTNLVSRDFGSWLFLGAILTEARLPPDEAEADHCGSCRACLDICPTKAFPAPYRLDARRCISYLTIENKGPIPRQFRKAIGNRVYGCDDCLAVCPWNKFARETHEAKLAARDDLVAPPLAELSVLDDAGFRDRFSGSPIKRIGRDRFLRNVMIAVGNSDDAGLAAMAERNITDPSPLVAGSAIWALGELDHDRALSLRPREVSDAALREEWDAIA